MLVQGQGTDVGALDPTPHGLNLRHEEATLVAGEDLVGLGIALDLVVAGRDHEGFVVEEVAVHVRHVEPRVPQLMDSVGVGNVPHEQDGGHVVAVGVELRQRVERRPGLGHVADDGELDGRRGGVAVGQTGVDVGRRRRPEGGGAVGLQHALGDLVLGLGDLRFDVGRRLLGIHVQRSVGVGAVVGRRGNVGGGPERCRC
mmetsp:Transcript_20732/g.59420  ORF Transcript_20732/g.59420 Transcript_20732/m.59420 type:complete len:200 (+) Transcript_20732:750-1349(+)